MDTEIFRRYFEIDSFERNRNSRKIAATLSTEYPAEMATGYREILEHTPQAIDLSRAPLPGLDSHKHDQTPQFRADELRIVGRKLKGVLTFGQGQRASELWQDIQDGILRHLSIFYVVKERTKPNVDGVYRVTRWQPLEVSVVSIPADLQAVIGRAFREVKKNQYEVMGGRENMMLRQYWTKGQKNKPIQSTEFRSFGEQLKCIADAGLAGTGDIPEMWDSRLQIDRASQGLSEESGGLGGFTAMQGVSEKLLFGQWSSPVVKKLLSIRVDGNYFGLKIPYAVSQDRTNGLHEGVQVYQVEQAGEITAITPELAALQPQFKKTVGFGYATEELFNDYNLLERWFYNVMGQDLTFDLERQTIRGTGHKEWLGLLNSGAKIRISKVGSQSANTVVSGNVIGMLSRFTSDSHRSNSAVWLYNPEILSQLYNLTTTVSSGGGQLNLFRFKGPGEEFNTLAGFPLIPSEHCSEIGSEGDLILVDLNYYLFIQKAIRQEISIHLRFLQDEFAFRAVLRSDGQPIINNPIKPAIGNSTTSPIITIESRV